MRKDNLPGRYNIIKDVVINAPQEEVWAVLEDFTEVSKWAPSVTESYGIANNEALQVGSGRHCEIEGFGGIDEYITQLAEGEGFVYSISPLGPLAASLNRWSLEAVTDKSTRLRIEFVYNVRFGIVGKILHALVMRKKLEKSLPETLTAVKRRVETGGAERQTAAMHTVLAA